MSSPTEAKLVLLQRKLDKSLEGLEEYIDIVREEGRRVITRTWSPCTQRCYSRKGGTHLVRCT